MNDSIFLVVWHFHIFPANEHIEAHSHTIFSIIFLNLFLEPPERCFFSVCKNDKQISIILKLGKRAYVSPHLAPLYVPCSYTQHTYPSLYLQHALRWDGRDFSSHIFCWEIGKMGEYIIYMP